LPQFRGRPKVCVELRDDASSLNYSMIMNEYAEWRGNCLLTKLFELSEENCGCRLIDDPRISNVTSFKPLFNSLGYYCAQKLSFALLA
jgi:hypothetical protein